MADISKYLEKNSKKVLSYLKLLLNERCLISAAFGDGEKDTFLTALIDLNEKQQTLTIDCGPKEYLNKKLLSSAIIKFSTEYQGIKVFFEGRKVKKSGSSNNPSFIVPIPGSMYWVQRRQFYRIKSPLSKNSFCSITHHDEKTEEDTNIELKLYDISASGFCVLNESHEISNLFVATAEFDNAKLVLEDEMELPIAFEVRYKQPLNPSNPNKTERIGCRILNTTPRLESTILRYMQNIDREIKQKEL